MTTLQLRKKIHTYVDQADENLLEIVRMLFERELRFKDFEISEQDWQEIERRREAFRSGKEKGVSAQKALSDLRKKLKKSRQ